MPSATLKFPASYSVGAERFLKGEKRTIGSDLANYLDGNPNFEVDWGGAARPAKSTFPAAPATAAVAPPAEEAGPEALTLVEAIDQVDAEADSNFEEDGKPTTAVLSELMGREVSAEERDAAMAQATRQPAPSDPGPGRTRIIRKKAAAPDPTTEGATEI